jgi:hypothetical protein
MNDTRNQTFIQLKKTTVNYNRIIKNKSIFFNINHLIMLLWSVEEDAWLPTLFCCVFMSFQMSCDFLNYHEI